MRSAVLDDPIGLFLPGCADDERKLRERLMRAREFATSKVVYLRSPNARILTWMLLETVSSHLYASASQEDLRDVISQCLRLALCADHFEREVAAQ
jgi:hypothetical protein